MTTPTPPPPPPLKICRRCKAAKRKAGWACRSCGARCCEHLCALKSMRGGPAQPTTALATCGGLFSPFLEGAATVTGTKNRWPIFGVGYYEQFVPAGTVGGCCQISPS